MDNLFNELYNQILDEQNIEEDVCNVCHYKTTSDKVMLYCNHIFHKKCIKKLKFCPYCEKPLKIKEEIVNEDSKCKFIMMSGKNKGKVCGRINCGYHKKNTVQNVCKQILKSGNNKGKECGRINCKIHKNIII